MIAASRPLLIGAVAAVGVLHTLVPDHWLPIAVLARQRGWSRSETARAALQAGTGHVLSTLALALLVWIAGSVAARRLGAAIDTVSSLGLIGFGLWVAVSGWPKPDRHHAHFGQPGGDPAAHSHDSDAQSDHGHRDERTSRTALLLMVGSSPMVEGIPAFFAAGEHGAGLVVVMAAVFALATIATYVLLCVTSVSAVRRFRWEALERCGEVLSGAAIAGVGLAFRLWPSLR